MSLPIADPALGGNVLEALLDSEAVSVCAIAVRPTVSSNYATVSSSRR
jgi:hypothetical protein